jgi:apolipoprotein N-acyltransferase
MVLAVRSPERDQIVSAGKSLKLDSQYNAEERGRMSSSRRSGYESLSVGYLIIAFAISIAIAWALADWILVIPVFLLEAGVFYAVLGVYTRRKEKDPKAASSSSYIIFWGGTVALVGAIWLLNRQYPGNVPLLIVVFLVWVGLFAIVLSLPRFRQSGG